jgi:YVTN family beta-propeller protein
MENAMDRCLRSSALRCGLLVVGFGVAATGSVAPVRAQELCGGTTYPFPYTDVSAVGAAFCPGIMEAYVTGVSKGTSPTAFSPDETVTRLQMTTFLQRSLDQGLTRASRRGALNQWSVPKFRAMMQTITLPTTPLFCAADGENIWTMYGNSVAQIRAATGFISGTWTGVTNGEAVLVTAGKVFVAGNTSPGSLYVIDPTKPPGTATLAASNLGNQPVGIATDGTYIWTADVGPPGSVSFVFLPSYVVSIQTAGFSAPFGILYDGANIWVTDSGANTLLKLDPTNAAILQTVPVGSGPNFPAFDGANIWVPNYYDDSITVVQASTGTIVATITTNANNKLHRPTGVSFDGERVLVTNYLGDSVTVFKAADLSLIANVPTGAVTGPYTACSDGINFWVNNQGSPYLLRF